MYRTGRVTLPLHSGHCPRWLFSRMIGLCREISKAIIFEYSEEEFLKRLSNPFFFQALGCTIGFDWHSSGLTTTTCGALKEAINKEELGVKVAGGKGAASRRTLDDITNFGGSQIEELIYASKTSAKVDNTLVQDNYQLYHHVIIFSSEGDWTVIQQGLNPGNRYARRYHWLSCRTAKLSDYIEQPHQAICCDVIGDALDLTSRSAREARKVSLDLVKDNPEHLKRYLSKQATLTDFHLPRIHQMPEMNKRNLTTLRRAFEIQPETYEELINIKGIGPKTVRALAFISKLIYGTNLSWRDPVTFSFAHGGKDGIPYPVDRGLLDDSIYLLRDAVESAKIGTKEKVKAVKRLGSKYSI